MFTIRLSLSGKRIEANPTQRLGEEFRDYLGAMSAIGGRYDPVKRVQHFPEARLSDAIRELKVSGFGVEVDEALGSRLESALAAGSSEHENARQLHDSAIERMDSIDQQLSARGLALYPYQRDGVRWLSHRKGAGLFDEMGLGKQQAVYSLVLTPDGWRRIGDLLPGDRITRSDGLEANVTGVFPQGIRPIFRVTFSDGSSTLAGTDHLWIVRYRRGGKAWQDLVLTTEQLRTRPVVPQTFRWKAKGTKTTMLDLSRTTLYLPMLSGPADFPLNSLPVPPYTLGALIANGGLTSGTPRLTTNERDSDEVLSRLEKDAGGRP